MQTKERGAGVVQPNAGNLLALKRHPVPSTRKQGAAAVIFLDRRVSRPLALQTFCLLLPSRAARLDRSIPLLDVDRACNSAASKGTASCSDRASRSLAAGCAPVRNFSDPIFGRILPFDASSASQASLAPHHVWICLQIEPVSQSHCHLHAYFLRLPVKQLLFNYCPQMPTYEADTCMQNTASITAQYG